jgi:hypothetical protein
MKRLELCDDPAAKEYLRYTTAQMMNGNFNYQIMFEGWVLPQQRAQQCVLLILRCRGLILVLDRHDDDKCKLSRPEEGYASCSTYIMVCALFGCRLRQSLQQNRLPPHFALLAWGLLLLLSP